MNIKRAYSSIIVLVITAHASFAMKQQIALITSDPAKQKIVKKSKFEELKQIFAQIITQADKDTFIDLCAVTSWSLNKNL